MSSGNRGMLSARSERVGDGAFVDTLVAAPGSVESGGRPQADAERAAVVASALLVGILLPVASACGAPGSGAANVSFGEGGVVRTDFGGHDRAAAVVMQPDGRIVAAGGRGNEFALARYLPDGRLDRLFGRGGKVVTDVGASAPAGWPRHGAVAVAVQRDGKIIAVGGLRQFVLVRYLPNGRLDSSFGTGGIVRTSFGGRGCRGQTFRDEATALALQDDGKIVAAGSSCYDLALARYLLSGRLDPSFGSGGKVVTHLGWDDFSGADALVVQPDRKLILAVGVCCHLGEAEVLVRLTNQGRLDPNFGQRGQTVFSLADQNGVAALALQADGSIVVAGWGMYVSQPPAGTPWKVYGLVRLTQAGRLDPTFGKRGRLVSAAVSGLGIEPDGKIVALDGNSLVRYTPDGRLDARFGSGGKQTRFAVGGTALALQHDGKIVVVGSTGASRKHDFMLVRYTRAGKIDS